MTDALCFMGPGDYELEKAMPPGTDSFQLETAPSGHSVLPCCEYAPASNITEHTLTLIASRREAAGRHAGQCVPPPPAAPPVLPPSAARGETLIPPPAVRHPTSIDGHMPVEVARLQPAYRPQRALPS